MDNKALFCSFIINKFYIAIDDEVGLDSISLNLYSVCVPNEKPKDLCIYSTGLWLNRPEIFKLEILFLENTLTTKLN